MNSNYNKISIQYGIITGIVYVLLLLMRYLFFSSSPLSFSVVMFISYLIILVFFIMAGIARRKAQGGYAEIKDIFQTIFITILIAEICYVLFNYIYLNFIDKEFWDRFMQNMIVFVKKMGGDEEKIQKQMAQLNEQKEQSKSIGKMLMGLGIWIVVDSIFGLLISLALKKKKPFSEFDTVNQ